MKKIISTIIFSLLLVKPDFCLSQAFFTSAIQNSPSLIDGVDFTRLAEYASPAVVDIQTESKFNVFINDPFFSHFFGAKKPTAVVLSSGSAVIISPSGYLITCAHVVENSEKVTVHLADKRRFEAQKLAVFKEIDLAILKIENKNGIDLPYLKLGSTKDIKKGAPVAALGNSFNLGQTFTNGIISATKRRLQVNSEESSPIVLQHNAAVNPGNSGGALVDKFGNLLGINNAIYSKSGGSNGVAFAIPVEIIKAYLIKQQEGIVGSTFGFNDVKTLTQKDLEAFRDAANFTFDGGVVLSTVDKDSSVEKAGFKAGDIIVGIDDHEIEYQTDIAFLESTLKPGTEANVKIWRKEQIVTIPLKTSKIDESTVANIVAKDAPILQGIIFAKLKRQDATKNKLKSDIKALIVKESNCKPGEDGISQANPFGMSLFAMEFQKGDILVSINSVPVFDQATLDEAVKKANIEQRYTFVLIRGGSQITMNLEIPKVAIQGAAVKPQGLL